MSSGTPSSDRLTEALDSVVAEDAQQGRLDDTEIQRLVVLSRMPPINALNACR